MGNKGDKLGQDSVETAELLEEKLAPIGGITIKKMFGGHGIFHEGKMFGIIDSKGKAFLRADDSNKSVYAEKGSDKHSKMPYFSIPGQIWDDHEELLKWVQTSIDISKK